MRLYELSQELSTLIQNHGESVAQVSGRRRLPASGVIWSSDEQSALLLTANHVLEHGHPLRVTLADGEALPAKIIGRDPNLDLALVEIPRPAPTAQWADENSTPQVGELMLALGRPFGQVEASLGILRAPPQRHERESEQRWDEGKEPPDIDSDDFDLEDTLQDTIERVSRSAERAARHAEKIARRAVRHFELTDDPEISAFHPRRRARFARHFRPPPRGALPLHMVLYPGFSGGPLLRLDGKTLGLNTSAFGESHSLPISLLREAVTALQKGKPTSSRRFLGVSGQTVRLPRALALEVEQESGLLLTSIRSGSHAERAGLLLGDTLLSLAGQRITSMGALRAFLQLERIEFPFELRLVRAGRLESINLEEPQAD